MLLALYYIWDTWAYRHETPAAHRSRRDAACSRCSVAGLINMLWLLGVVVAVATLDPGKPFPGTRWHAVAVPARDRAARAGRPVAADDAPQACARENQFNYAAIGEVACLFIGIFITMQVPIEILQAKGPELGLTQPVAVLLGQRRR